MLRSIHDRSTFVALRHAPLGRCGPVRVRVVPPAASASADAAAPAPADAADPRVAFALPRRIGGAVVRNRVRRRLRAVMAELGHSGSASSPTAGRLHPGAAYLVVADADVISCPFSELQTHVDEAVGRAHRRAGIEVGT